MLIKPEYDKLLSEQKVSKARDIPGIFWYKLDFMGKNYSNFLQKRLDEENFNKLVALDNLEVVNFIGEYVELCNPKQVFVRTDSPQDIAYLRGKSILLGEEKKLALEGQTIHFDGYFDQARDKKNTKYLVSKGANAGNYLNSVERGEGLGEVRGFLKDIMTGKDMFVCFFCLGPANSEFSILAVQITDSAYVAHSEDILFRPGYEQFRNNKVRGSFFKMLHSAGELENHVSKNVNKRRVYIDLENNLVYSVNTQYAGNSVGLKKLSLRLAIQKASREGWLAEHMFLMSVSDREGKKSYFCGAYPSMCGKTSTAMLSGEHIIGDDIAYLRVRKGEVYAVNVERGIFGIIKDVNAGDDPVIFKFLNSKGEIIFSNILVDEQGVPFWIGKSNQMPQRGINFSGAWSSDKTDESGNPISISHKNARYTIRLETLENVDENLENPKGVAIKGFIYGGRDSDTSVPVEEAFNWQQGIITKAASLESETTAATLGKEGVRVFNPMANMDFLSIPLGKYIEMNLDFGKKLKSPPLIFSVNYFLKNKDNMYLNAIEDKLIWLKWMKLRADKKVKALITPTGLIPKYEDLKALFKDVLGKEYTKESYTEQFSLRLPENLAKIKRIKSIYKGLPGLPACLLEELEAQGKRLIKSQKEFGDCIEPKNFQSTE